MVFFGCLFFDNLFNIGNKKVVVLLVFVCVIVIKFLFLSIIGIVCFCIGVYFLKCIVLSVLSILLFNCNLENFIVYFICL